MWRKLALSLAVAGVLGASQAHALGLGQIRIKSALNEPLDAEIQLLQVRDLDPMQVLPKMADLDQFAMAGIDRSRLLSDVKFKVNINQNGTGSIRLTSSRPVREPFLNLLVEVNWPNGRLVREYTVLLDPPAFQAAAIGGSTAPEPAQVARAAVPAPQPVFAPPSRSRPPANNIRTNMNAQTQVFVETNDTLGGLAKRHLPAGANINQMMLALQRKNPQAFPSSNINFLKAGVVLDIPSPSEVKALSAREAANEVARQMQRWKAGTAAPAPSAPQQDGSKKKPLAPDDAQPAAVAAGEGQLKILSAPDQADTAQDETGSAKVAEASITDPEKAELLRRNEELENRLAVTQESVDKIERENSELNDKLTAISQQMETLQRLLELKDQQLAALQDQLQQVQPAAAVPESSAAPAPKTPSGIIETVLQTPAYMAGLGAVLGGLLVGLIALGRRRRDDDGEDASDDTHLETRHEMNKESGAALAGAAVATAGATAVWIPAEEPESEQDTVASETQSEDVPTGAAADAADFDLDLDLDLDLADDAALTAAAASTEPKASSDRPLFEDDEFDLGLDTDFEEEAPAKSQVADVDDDFDDSLDDLLGLAPGDEAEAERAALRSGMGQLDTGVEEFEEPEETLESLGLDSVIEASNVPRSAEEEVSDYRPGSKVETSVSDEDDGLDFRLNQVAPLDLAQDDDLIDAHKGKAEPEVEAASDAAPEVEFAQPDADLNQEEEAGAPVENVLDEQPTPEAVVQPAVESESVDSDDDALEFELDDALVFNPPQTGEAAGDEPAAVEPEEALDDLDDLLAESMPAEVGEAPDEVELEYHGDDDDLDAMLAALESESGPEADAVDAQALSLDEDDHDLEVSLDDDMDLDTELEALLGSVDDDIALDESGADDEDRGFEDMGFLEGTDEVETKLDLARAYIDMEDRDGAKDILSEILSEGSDVQQQEARKLMESIA